AQVEQAAQEQQLVKQLEAWLFPPKPAHLDAPRAGLRVLCEARPDEDRPARHRLVVRFHLSRPRAGEKIKALDELIDLTTRAAHEQELFPPADWEFIQWLAETRSTRRNGEEELVLSELDLLHWLARWGHTSRLEFSSSNGAQSLEFHGQVAELTP